jgi:hypothetical protein
LHAGVLGFDLANKTATLWDGGSNAFSATNEDDVGNAVVSILTHPTETANQYLYVATVTTTQKAILSSLEAQTGQKWKVEDVKSEAQVALGRQKMSEGDFSGVLLLVQAAGLGCIPGTRANYAIEERLANPILGLPEGSVDGTVKKALNL